MQMRERGKKYELTDSTVALHNFGTAEQNGGGCYVKTTTIFLILILVVVLSLGVGLLVYLVGSREVVCSIQWGTTTQAPATTTTTDHNLTRALCMKWAENGDVEICGACPDKLSSTSSTPPTTSPPTSTKAPRIDYRLPSTISPFHYNVELTPNIYGPDPELFNFEGVVLIHITCLEATNQIVLHVDRLDVNNQTLQFGSLARSNAPLVEGVEYESLRHFYTIFLDGPLVPGQKYYIRMTFTGPLTQDGIGLYYSFYQDGDAKVYLATTQMEPVFTRKVFPCFDEPALKSTFNITLVRKQDGGTQRKYMSLANMDRIGEEPRVGGFTADVYATTPLMPTYLLAFIVCDFKYLEKTTKSGIKYRTFAAPNAIQYAVEPQNYGVKIFEKYEDFFDPPYVIDKLDNIAIPDFMYGAMENWGLIVYRERLLQQPGTSSARDLLWMAEVISHEIAHQWFGNIVSPKWWNWLWLNEAFASFWDYHMVGELHPEWRELDLHVSEAMHFALTADSVHTSHPLTVDVMTPNEINDIFDVITYSKGSCIIRMMYLTMGNASFIKGLNAYLEAQKFGSAETADLWKALNEESKLRNFNMTEIMDPWVTQMNYPVVMVTRPTSGVIHLTQKRFLIEETQTVTNYIASPPYNYKWTIPITYTSSVKPDFNRTYEYESIVWMNKDGTPLTVTSADIPVNSDDSWVIVNVKQSGFYRVNYEEKNWLAIIKQLEKEHTVIDPINRGQLINDAWNLVKAGLLNQSIALKIQNYMKQEVDFVPWRAFLRESTYLKLMLRRTDIYGKYEKFISTAVDTAFKTLGLEITDDMVPIDKLNRANIATLACNYGHQGCISIATSKFQEWMKEETKNLIDPNLCSILYCTAVRVGRWNEWEFVYKMYHRSSSSTELARLRRAMTCTKELSLLRRVLDMSLDSAEIRVQDSSSTIADVARNPWGREMAWDFVTTQYADIFSKKSVAELNRMISALTESFNTEADLKKIESFMKSGIELAGGAAAFRSALEKTHNNIKWTKNNYPIIRAWLDEHETPTPSTYRLPTSVIPHHYNVEIKPNIYGSDPTAFNFEGSVQIEVEITEKTQNITLLKWESLTIDESSLRVTRKRLGIDPRKSVRTSYNPTNHFYVIHVDIDLEVGEKYIVSANFTGPLKQDGTGLYLDYYKLNGKTVYLVATQFEANRASKVFPCFDEPGYRSTFKVTLLRSDTDNYISLSNAELIRTDPRPDGFVADVFAQTPKMAVYLLAMAVCDFKYLENNTTTGVRFRTYARPNAQDLAVSPQQFGLEIFERFEQHFNPDYPISKLDSIALPSKGGAMENWGLITYSEQLLHHPNASYAPDYVWMVIVSAHELAHQWFGNVVTPKWWNWLWLSESFATYYEHFLPHELYPQFRLDELYIEDSVYSGFSSDSHQTSHPMTSNVTTIAEMSANFDNIAYQRGSTIIRMMPLIMGKDAFIRGLNNYLQNNEYGSVEHQDLWDGLTQEVLQSGRSFNMTELMDPWVTQMNYPVVMVTRPANHTLGLSQSRFIIGPTDKAPTEEGLYKYKWDIPITYTSSQNPNFEPVYGYEQLDWLKKDGNPVMIENSSLIPANGGDSWVVVNVQQSAFFRVNYDDENWNALIRQLETNHKVIHVINRGQIINDAWNLAKAGLLSQSIALRTVNYLQNDLDYLPWKAFLDELTYVDQMLERTDAFQLLESFMLRTVEGPLKSLGMNIDNDMLPIDVYARTQLTSQACKYGSDDCVNNATSLVRRWMADNTTNPINVNLRKTFYCMAVETGSWDVWDFIRDVYLQTTDNAEKLRLLSALTCTKLPVLINRILDMSLDDTKVRPSQMRYVFIGLANNRIGRELVWNYFRGHYSSVAANLSSSGLGRLIALLTAKFNTEADRKQIEEFVNSGQDLSKAATAFQTAIEKTQTNIRWMEQNYDVLKQWLQQ